MKRLFRRSDRLATMRRPRQSLLLTMITHLQSQSQVATRCTLLEPTVDSHYLLVYHYNTATLTAPFSNYNTVRKIASAMRYAPFNSVRHICRQKYVQSPHLFSSIKNKIFYNSAQLYTYIFTKILWY